MRDALLHDLRQIPGVHVSCTHDPRLPAPSDAHEAIAIAAGDPWQSWACCIAQADAVLPVAPESGGALLRLTQMVGEQGKVLLGCCVDGVALAGSKLTTCRVLQSAGIDAVPTWPADVFSFDRFERFVVKPDDGVGGEGSLIFFDAVACRDWLASKPAVNHVIQPYMRGTPASLSMLCRDGRAWLLSCNLQKVIEYAGGFVYEGSVVNGAIEHWAEFERMAQEIARALPVLSGYIGVDVIMHDSSITVLEINPRITTSYAGLHRAMGCNPAGLLIDLLYNSRFSSAGFQMPANIQRNEVEVSLHG
jgi:predicted ATP-grasp superfamily ATP-dependent carboligase